MKNIIDFAKNAKPDLLGEDTNFRRIVSKMVEATVLNGGWFAFCTRVSDSQKDLFSMLNKDGDKLGSLVFNALDEEDMGYRATLYGYLLSDYLCYCEIPTVVRRSDHSGFKDSYSKSLVTSNINVVAKWLDIPIDEAELKYGSRLDLGYSREDEMYPYVKLTVGKDGTRKVTKPRKDLELATKGIRIIPLFAIQKGIEVLFDMCSKDFYNITFVKDSGQERVVNVCFDFDKLSSVYKDKGKLVEAYEEQFKGDFLNSASLSRGYIRVIEVGTNLKNYALRSINLARILKVEKAEPDLTFVNVDLDAVKSTFLNMLCSKKVNYADLVSALDLFQVGSDRNYNGKPISSYSELESWVDMQEVLLSTPFIKQLALFMIGNPQWFEGYTGDSSIVDSMVENDDYTLDDDLDDFDLVLDI